MIDRPRLLMMYAATDWDYSLHDTLFSLSYYRKAILDSRTAPSVRAKAFLEMSSLDGFEASLSSKMIDAWIQDALFSEDPEVQLRLVLAARSGRMGEDAMGVLMGIVQSSRHDRVREKALDALAHNYRDDPFVEVIVIEAIDDPSERVRKAAKKIQRRFF